MKQQLNEIITSSYKDFLSTLLEGRRQKHDKLRFFGSYSAHVFSALDYLVEILYVEGKKINTASIYKQLEKLADDLECVRNLWDFKDLSRVKNITCESEDSTLVAVGVLTEDYHSSDDDCYQTAGGYRAYLAKKGTVVYYHLDQYLNVYAKVQSSLMIDHYNNNFFGVSTGNGTTNYEEGQNVVTRTLALNSSFPYKVAAKKETKKIEASIIKIDLTKIKGIVEVNQPEILEFYNLRHY